MNYFIIGDIHGCFFTLKNILKYKLKDDYLICVGDYIDRGKYTTEVIDLLLQYISRGNTTLLIGNHEYFFYKYLNNENDINLKYLHKDFEITYSQLKFNGINDNKIFEFFNNLKLFHNNKNFIVTHSGIKQSVYKTIDLSKTMLGFKQTLLVDDFIMSRDIPDNIGKIQIHGHTPISCFNPVFFSNSNSWNIDTGAFLGWGLSALKISDTGTIIAKYFERTCSKDI